MTLHCVSTTETSNQQASGAVCALFVAHLYRQCAFRRSLVCGCRFLRRCLRRCDGRARTRRNMLLTTTTIPAVLTNAFEHVLKKSPPSSSLIVTLSFRRIRIRLRFVRALQLPISDDDDDDENERDIRFIYQSITIKKSTTVYLLSLLTNTTFVHRINPRVVVSCPVIAAATPMLHAFFLESNIMPPFR